MFELITSESINGLTNSELKRELKKVTTAIGTIGKKTKEMAISINNIMSEESYKDDFKSDTEFAKFLGTSKGNLSKISRAGKLLKENENLSAFNLGQIEETLSLNDEIRNYIIEEKEIEPSMTVKEVREVVNAYKSDGKEETEETEETEKTKVSEDDGFVPYQLKYIQLSITMENPKTGKEDSRLFQATSKDGVNDLIKELKKYL